MGLFRNREDERFKAHAARFCAFRRDFAGVMVSFSSLLLLLRWS